MKRCKIIASPATLAEVGIDYDITEKVADIIYDYGDGYYKVNIDYIYEGMSLNNDFDLPYYFVKLL